MTTVAKDVRTDAQSMALLAGSIVEAVMNEGAAKYGDPFNFETRTTVVDSVQHAVNHIAKWDANDESEDHLAHAITRLVMAYHLNTKGAQHA